MPASLRNRLDGDVYQIIRRLEAVNDDGPLESVSVIYNAIKQSNSSLSRQKRRPLEDAIERALRVLKQQRQQDQSHDSDAAIDEPEPQQAGQTGFLLNRQMTKLWNVDRSVPAPSAQPASKKRRVQDGTDHSEGPIPNMAVDGPGSAPVVATTSSKHDKPGVRTQPKPNRFFVEQPGQPTPLAGYDQLYHELMVKARHVLRRRSLYENSTMQPNFGFLLSGPPGVGKKTLVRNLASKLQVPLVFLTKCFLDHEGMEKSLIRAFDTAISLAPCIVFIDNLDLYMAGPGSSIHNDHHAKAVFYFAEQMARANVPLVAVAATSDPTEIDPQVLRGNLLNESFQMKAPNSLSRHQILKVWTREMPLADDVDLGEIAKLTHGFVGADLLDVVRFVKRSFVERHFSADDPDAATELDSEMPEQCDLTDRLDIDNARIANPINSPPVMAGTVTMEDFKAITADFTPLLRAQGFSVIPSVTWDQVGALDMVRKQLKTSIIGPIKHPELYRNFGLSQWAGVLLWGPPGCGKTLIAQAVANEAQASFILINGPELLNKYVGESERAVRELFKRARSSTPCILFFDEIDSIVPPRRNASTESGARVVNALLTELDGVMDRSGIYVIGTTNRPEMIDEAVLRPGRLGIHLFVDLPTAEERYDILKAIFRTRHDNATNEALDRLALVALDPRCANFSGADLSGLHGKAAEHALERWLAEGEGPQVIAHEDWEFALENTVASVKDVYSYKLRADKFGG